MRTVREKKETEEKESEEKESEKIYRTSRKKIKMRDKVEKSRNAAMFCGPRSKAAGAEPSGGIRDQKLSIAAADFKIKMLNTP